MEEDCKNWEGCQYSQADSCRKEHDSPHDTLHWDHKCLGTGPHICFVHMLLLYCNLYSEHTLVDSQCKDLLNILADMYMNQHHYVPCIQHLHHMVMDCKAQETQLAAQLQVMERCTGSCKIKNSWAACHRLHLWSQYIYQQNALSKIQ